MKTIAEMDAAIAEAKQIRARHDGVHLVHSYIAVMTMCRELLAIGEWAHHAEPMFDQAWANVRYVGRTGFAPKSVANVRASRRAAVPAALLAEA